MALPPSIPTSFVPKQPVEPTRRRSASLSVFSYIGFFVGVIAVVGAGLVFGYQKYLETVLASKQAKLEAAEKAINTDQVEDYVRLRDRLRESEILLNQHVLTSQFLSVLEGLTLQNVRFESMKLEVKSDRSATIMMSGAAKSFNALAAESSAFAAEKRIKRAIFSGITVDKNGVVSFELNAELDPKLLLGMPGSVPSGAATTSMPAATNIAPQSLPVATSTKTRTATTTP